MSFIYPSQRTVDLSCGIVRGPLRVYFEGVKKMEVRGRENIPTRGPCMILPKHQSYADPLIVGLALGGIANPRYVMRPLGFGLHVPLRLIGGLTFFRPDGIKRVNRRELLGRNSDLGIFVEDELSGPNGYVVVFPEGTRSPGRMSEFKRRFFYRGVEVGRRTKRRVAFQPVGIELGERPSITFGKPLYDEGNVADLVDRCYDSVRNLSNIK